MPIGAPPPDRNPSSPTSLSPLVHGTNPNHLHYYYPDQPYTNRMRTARRFGTYDTAGNSRLSITLADPRTDGYPASLVAGTEARTACAGPASSHLGEWFCEWDGRGQVRFDTGDGNTTSPANTLNGSISRTIAARPDRMGITILATDATNPVRNIRVFDGPYRNFLLGDGIDPDYRSRTVASRVNAMRFMNQQDTARSAIVTASQLPDPSYFTDSALDDRDDETLYTAIGCRTQHIVTMAQAFNLDYVQLQAPHRVWEDPSHTWINTVIPAVLAGLANDKRIVLGLSNEVWEGHSAGTPYFQDAGVNGIPGVIAAFTVGSDTDKMDKAYAVGCKRLFAQARLAATNAGFDPNRVLRVIECQAAAGVAYHHPLRTRDYTDEQNPLPFGYDFYSPSFYYGNNLGNDQAFALTSVTGTFTVGELVNNGLGGGSRREGTYIGIIAGRHVVTLDRSPYTAFSAAQNLIGATSAAHGTISDDGLPNTFLPTWTSQEFFDYGLLDMTRRAIDGPDGLVALATLVAGDNATLLPYEGGGHEWSSGYDAPALAALYAFYRDDKVRLLFNYLFFRLRGLPYSNGHGMYFQAAGFPFGLFESYLDDDGVRPGYNGLRNEPKFIAFVEAGTTLLGSGPQVNFPPVLTNPGTQTVLVGASLDLQLEWTDPNPGDHHTVTCQNLPVGFTCSPSGRIQGPWSTAASLQSPVMLIARVTDDGNPPMFDEEAFSLVIERQGGGGPGTNYPPVVTNPGNQAATEGTLFSVQVRWTDPNLGDHHVVTWTGLPSWLVGNTLGLAAGTPPLGAAAGSPHTITVRVTDDGTPPLYDEKTFVLTVTAGGGNGGGLNFNLNFSGASIATVAPMLKESYMRSRRG